MVLIVLPLLLMMIADGVATAEPRGGRLSMAEEVARLLSGPDRRVRSTEGRLAGLIDAGVQRSYSFAELVRSLHETDVIVYVETLHDLPRAVNGHTFLVSSTDTQRYLRIQLRPGLPPNETIALLAHELRHALEVATDPGVTTQAAFSGLYERIGHPVPGFSKRFDTPAAQQMGRVVRQELGG